MEIVEQYVCECNPKFNYKSKGSFNAHKKSRKHVAFSTKRKEESILATRRDNEIDLLNRMIEKITREKINLEIENENLKCENLNFKLKIKNIFNESA